MISRTPFFFKMALLGSGIVFIATSFISNPSTSNAQERGYATNEIRTDSIKPKEVVVDFREVAKKTIPAVVSIQVQSKKRSSVFGNGDQNDESSDLFGNDFWQFFGILRKELLPQPLVGQASGVIVSHDGYILTNSHVVNGMETITVQLVDGREFKAKVLGEDTNSDLALIKIDADDLPFLKLGNSDDLEVGQWVAAIGNPFGLQATLTVGVVSAKGRNNLDIIRYEDFIQTDAAINRGNSGGALVTLNGDVIGINTAIATNTSSSYMGIGFAIPSNMARHVMEDIISNGKVSRGFLGITLQSIDYNLAQAFDLKKVQGALVSSVMKDSPADRAGIKIEDIILEYDAHPVENAASLRNRIYMMHPGTRLTLSILRQGKMISIPVEVGQYLEEAAQVATIPEQKNSLGIEVDNLKPETAHALGYTNEKGVIITKVQTGSTASLAGLKKGSLILGVNRQKTENIDQFYQSLSKTPKDRPILLQVKQGDRYFFISIHAD